MSMQLLKSFERRNEINRSSLAALDVNGVRRNGCDVTAEVRSRLIDQIENLDAAIADLRSING